MRYVVKFGSLLLLTLCLWQVVYAQNGKFFILRWQAPTEQYPSPLLYYRVYRGFVPGQLGIYQDGVAGLVMTDVNVQPGVRYYYAVTALYADSEESSRTNEVSAIIPGGGCN